MKSLLRRNLVVVFVLLLAAMQAVRGQDRFFYQNESDWENAIMSPSDWDQVECDDFATCVSTKGIRCDT